MAAVVVLFGLFLGGLGALGVVRPERLVAFARSWQTPVGLYAAAALRIVLGLALVLAASGSRTPLTFRILGIVILVGGVLTPLVGQERFHRLLEWWAGRSPAFQRGWAGCALAFGLFLIYAVTP